MAPATNPKIEELRFRLKTDPKSRLFFPLAEELRKISQFGEAEQVLRAGLTHHPTYLSAWVSLGRVLRDGSKHQEAAEALSKALTIDPGNVVAARLLGDAYLGLGQHVEAIKKYKLVRALLPSDDEDLDATIEKLEQEIKGGAAAVASPPAEVPAAAPEPVEVPVAAIEQTIIEPESVVAGDEGPADATGDAEPMRAAHMESPFEEPSADLGYSPDAFELEQPPGIHIEPAPLSADLPVPIPEEEDAFAASPVSAPVVAEAEPDDVFAPSEEPSFPTFAPPPPPDADDFAKTITMADLYAQQGLVDEARDIYEDVLLRDPSNHFVRAKLEALESAQAPAIEPETEPEPEPELEAAPFDEPLHEPFEQAAPEPMHAAFEPQFEEPQFEEPPVEEPHIEEPHIEEPRLQEAHVEPPVGAFAQQPPAPAARSPKISRLESWLAKVSK